MGEGVRLMPDPDGTREVCACPDLCTSAVHEAVGERDSVLEQVWPWHSEQAKVGQRSALLHSHQSAHALFSHQVNSDFPLVGANPAFALCPKFVSVSADQRKNCSWIKKMLKLLTVLSGLRQSSDRKSVSLLWAPLPVVRKKMLDHTLTWNTTWKVADYARNINHIKNVPGSYEEGIPCLPGGFFWWGEVRVRIGKVVQLS